MQTAIKNSRAFQPVRYTPENTRLIQALARGTASEEQQKNALRFIIEDVCCYYDLSFRPDSERESCFAEGKRFVGAQLVTMTKLIPEKLKEKETK